TGQPDRDRVDHEQTLRTCAQHDVAAHDRSAPARQRQLRLLVFAGTEYVQCGGKRRQLDRLRLATGYLDTDLQHRGCPDRNPVVRQRRVHLRLVLRKQCTQYEQRSSEHYQSRATGVRRWPLRSLSRVRSRSSCSTADRICSACSRDIGCCSKREPDCCPWPACPCDGSAWPSCSCACASSSRFWLSCSC